MSSLKISIVTPTYNSAAYIRETMESIHNQSYKNIEHIVMDGLSKDNTVAIVNEFPARCVSEKDKGQSDALNKGFRQVTGDILAWQNADDLYCPGAFQTVVDFFESHPDVDIVYGYYQLIDQDSKWICDVFPIQWNEWLFVHGRFCPPQPTAFWRKRVYDAVGDLNVNLHYCMDVDFYSRVVNKGFKFHRLPVMMGQFRVHQDSKTQNVDNDEKVKREHQQVLAKNFSYSAFDSFLFNVFKFRSSITKNLKMKWLKKL
jgi:glycosyltransferase involved in cell wall biosynthesis